MKRNNGSNDSVKNGRKERDKNVLTHEKKRRRVRVSKIDDILASKLPNESISLSDIKKITKICYNDNGFTKVSMQETEYLNEMDIEDANFERIRRQTCGDTEFEVWDDTEKCVEEIGNILNRKRLLQNDDMNAGERLKKNINSDFFPSNTGKVKEFIINCCKMSEQWDTIRDKIKKEYDVFFENGSSSIIYADINSNNNINRYILNDLMVDYFYNFKSIDFPPNSKNISVILKKNIKLLEDKSKGSLVIIYLNDGLYFSDIIILMNDDDDE